MDSAFITYASDVLGETNTGLSGSKIAEYSTAYAVKFDVNIPYSNYPFPDSAPNKRTALRKNIMAFNDEQQFFIIKELCELPDFAENDDARALKTKLLSKYGKLYTDILISELELVQETIHWLSQYPRSLKIYNEALIKYDNRIYERNILDDMRLAFELLLKEILGNGKSLENQIAEIGQALKQTDVSKELRNMFNALINYYKDYQNTYIKHDDNVNVNEIEYMIELTSLLMKFLIRTIK